MGRIEEEDEDEDERNSKETGLGLPVAFTILTGGGPAAGDR
jgi:hypothetical protein